MIHGHYTNEQIIWFCTNIWRFSREEMTANFQARYQDPHFGRSQYQWLKIRYCMKKEWGASLNAPPYAGAVPGGPNTENYIPANMPAEGPLFETHSRSITPVPLLVDTARSSQEPAPAPVQQAPVAPQTVHHVTQSSPGPQNMSQTVAATAHAGTANTGCDMGTPTQALQAAMGAQELLNQEMLQRDVHRHFTHAPPGRGGYQFAVPHPEMTSSTPAMAVQGTAQSELSADQLAAIHQRQLHQLQLQQMQEQQKLQERIKRLEQIQLQEQKQQEQECLQMRLQQANLQHMPQPQPLAHGRLPINTSFSHLGGEMAPSRFRSIGDMPQVHNYQYMDLTPSGLACVQQQSEQPAVQEWVEDQHQQTMDLQSPFPLAPAPMEAPPMLSDMAPMAPMVHLAQMAQMTPMTPAREVIEIADDESLTEPAVRGTARYSPGRGAVQTPPKKTRGKGGKAGKSSNSSSKSSGKSSPKHKRPVTVDVSLPAKRIRTDDVRVLGRETFMPCEPLASSTSLATPSSPSATAETAADEADALWFQGMHEHCFFNVPHRHHAGGVFFPQGVDCMNVFRQASSAASAASAASSATSSPVLVEPAEPVTAPAATPVATPVGPLATPSSAESEAMDAEFLRVMEALDEEADRYPVPLPTGRPLRRLEDPSETERDMGLRPRTPPRSSSSDDIDSSVPPASLTLDPAQLVQTQTQTQTQTAPLDLAAEQEAMDAMVAALTASIHESDASDRLSALESSPLVSADGYFDQDKPPMDNASLPSAALPLNGDGIEYE